MAGVMMTGDEGMEVKEQSVPATGGSEYRGKIGMDDAIDAEVVASAHLGDANRAEGVAYPENPGVGGPDGAGYPAGTAMTDSSPGDDVN